VFRARGSQPQRRTTHVVVWPDGLGRSLRLGTRYEIGDGDLFLINEEGAVLRIPAGEWRGIGEIDADGDSFLIRQWAGEVAS
jgi:hypothetical protein